MPVNRRARKKIGGAAAPPMRIQNAYFKPYWNQMLDPSFRPILK